MHINTPYGAPVFQEMENRIDENGDAIVHPTRSWRKECRCFVKQETPGVIRAMDFHQEFPYYSDYGKRYYGPFKNAEVRFFVSNDAANAMEIYRSVGKEYYDKIIAPCVTEAVKVVTAQYTAEKLVSNRSELSIGIEEELTERLLGYNIQVVSTSIENFDFTDAFTDAVEAKQVAEQNKLKAETEAEQARIEAQAKADVRLIETKAEAEAQLIKAEAEAEAALIAAEAEAEANADKK